MGIRCKKFVRIFMLFKCWCCGWFELNIKFIVVELEIEMGFVGFVFCVDFYVIVKNICFLFLNVFELIRFFYEVNV